MGSRLPIRLVLCIGCLSLGVSMQGGYAELSRPPNSLGASNAHGYLQIWREIDELDFGNGLTQPLSVKFSSERQNNPSPYFGNGWWCPLLESRAYLKRDKMLRAELPCGQVIYLRQSKTDPNAYQTPNKQMAAVIDKEKGDITLVGSCCGEYRYRQGRLYQIKSPEGRLITLIYNGNVVTEIREEGRANSPFKLATTQSGVPTGMYVNGKLHSFELGKRPRVENASGTNVISGFDPTLAMWKFPDGKQETYQFEVDQDVSPNLKVTDRDNAESSYVWNAVTGHIVSDGEWTYEIGKTVGAFDLPKLRRVNSRGEEEFRYVDMAKGITEVKDLKKGHTITETFLSSGPLYGKVRKIEKVVDGKTVPVFQAGYDESGRLLRVVDAKGFTTINQFGKDGKLSGKIVKPPSDAAVVAALQATEKSLLQAVADAANRASRGDALQKLGLFYIHEMGEPAKALDLLPKMGNPKQVFNIKWHSIEGNMVLTDQQKAEQLASLLLEYPEKRPLLETLIAARNNQAKHSEKNSQNNSIAALQPNQ